MAVSEPVIIGTENKFIKDTTSKALTLYSTVSEPSGTYNALSSLGSSYLVPVGKKFIILSFTTWSSNTSFGAVQLLEHTVASSSGGTIVFDIENATDTDHKFSVLPTFQTYIEISAGNYINFYLEQARAYGIVYGVEVDA